VTPQRRNKEIIANFGTGAPVDPLRDVEGRAYGLHIVSELPEIYSQVFPKAGRVGLVVLIKSPVAADIAAGAADAAGAAAARALTFGFEAELKVPDGARVVVRPDAFGRGTVVSHRTVVQHSVAYTLCSVDVDAGVLARSRMRWFKGCGSISPRRMRVTATLEGQPDAQTAWFETHTKVRKDDTATAEQLLTMLVDADESSVYLPATDTFHRRMHSARTRVGLVFNRSRCRWLCGGRSVRSRPSSGLRRLLLASRDSVPGAPRVTNPPFWSCVSVILLIGKNIFVQRAPEHTVPRQ
jgi:hypothetical protein